MKSDKKMYCSEMVTKAIAKATQKRMVIKPTKLTAVEARIYASYARLSMEYVNGLEVIAIDNLYRQPWCSLVNEYSYR